MKKAALIIGLLVLLVAVLPLWLSFHFYTTTRAFLKHAVKTEATVAEVQQRTDSDGEIIYYPVFTYTAENGERYTKHGSGSYPPSYHEGDTVTLLYRRDNPAEARIDSFIGLWLAPVVLAVLGLIPLSIGGVVTLLGSYLADVVERSWPSEAAAAVPQDSTDSAGNAEKESRLWATLAHLGGLTVFVGIPAGNIIVPLVIWLAYRHTYPFVDDQGKEALNFQISIFIYGCAAVVLCFVLVGFLLLPVLLAADIVLMIVAAVKANSGRNYRYPMSLRLIR